MEFGRSAHRTSQIGERIRTVALPLPPTKIEQFVLHSCSPIGWDDLSYMLPGLSNVCLLDISLFHRSERSFRSFIFQKLRSIRLTLLEVSFKWIIQLVATMPSLVILKLNGLVDSEGFAIDHKWLHLLELAPSLVKVIVNVSLEEDTNSFCSDKIHAALREINLNLTCIEDDGDCYLSERNQQRWWDLTGMLIKHHGYVYQTVCPLLEPPDMN
jgi:hypothetical protein